MIGSGDPTPCAGFWLHQTRGRRGERGIARRLILGRLFVIRRKISVQGSHAAVLRKAGALTMYPIESLLARRLKTKRCTGSGRKSSHRNAGCRLPKVKRISGTSMTSAARAVHKDLGMMTSRRPAGQLCAEHAGATFLGTAEE